ncbi:MAG: hypothetical protein KME52_18605 [Desmonostoc geniculatum HA4340-LM1]|jgi:hypothetical protein|nr:hypothetical protein [Desmonostoc geniculatum HA4340-LM1]
MTITAAPKSLQPHKPESPYKRLHVIIPIEDMLWSQAQKPSVAQLWQECWTSDPYGSRWMPLNTTLGYSTFICAKKVLSETGLFIFKPDKSIQDGRETVGWMVRNLHGSRMKDFWEEADSEKQEPNSTKQESNSLNSEIDADSLQMRASNQASISSQTQSQQDFQEPSRTPQEHITNSSKEFVMCDSDTLSTNSGVDETAIALLGSASPSPVEIVSESEESPQVTDCTTLTLVDEQGGQSAPLLTENKDCGVEPTIAPEGECSAPQVEVITSLDKWSQEAIVQRRELRKDRENKLKLASMTGDNPGFDYLKECWEDVGLWLKIKQLIAQYPEWRIAYVNGRLARET